MEVIRETGLIRWYRRIKRLFVMLFLTVAFGLIALISLVLYLRSQPLPAVDILETTTIYGADEQVIDTLYQGENRYYVSLHQIPDSLKQATIAVEDRRFYSHFGFDPKRIGRAVWIDIQEKSLAQGASTITQQLARNLYLSLDKTWERKIREALLTIQLEVNYSKDQIFEKYLNEIYYGHSAYGVQAAARTYFGKDVSELTLAESALLAGIPKGPLYYSPFLNLEQSLQRQRTVLQAMVNEGYITRAQMNEAINEPLRFRTADEEPLAPSTAPYFRDFVIKEARDRYGIDENLIRHGGLKIYTTLDPVMQQKAEEVFEKYFPEEEEPLPQGALIAVDPRNGYIKAMVGGKDYQESQFNRIFARRQPGSSFKPFLYLAALENRFTPLTEMKSEPTEFRYGVNEEKVYKPRNFGDRYPNDYITLYEALIQSDNIYAVKTHMLLGEEKLKEMAARLGIESQVEAVPSLALGSYSVTPFEMARAYSTLANLGERVEPIAITRIIDRNGKVLVDEKPQRQRVADAGHVFVLNQMMQDIFRQGGTGYRVKHLLQRPASAKTGTTDYDAWMSGFTPQLVSTVWVGYDDGSPLRTVPDSRLAAEIWAEFMEKALADQAPALFPIPQGVTGVYIDLKSGKLAGENCPQPQFMYFVAGTEPEEFCDVHGGGNPENAGQSGEGEGLESNAGTPSSPYSNESFWKRVRDWWLSD